MVSPNPHAGGKFPDVFFGRNYDNHSDYRCGSHALRKRVAITDIAGDGNAGLYFVVESLTLVCGFLRNYGITVRNSLITNVEEI